MTRILTILVIILAAASGVRAESTLIQQADSAYMSDDFSVAVALYRQAITDEGPSAKLYYNLGNSYYRIGKTGEAVLAYERALRLDPTDTDVRHNLEFVNSRLTDRPGERGTFIGNALDAVATAASPNTWAWVTFTLFALTAASLLVYLFLDNVTIRKIGFFGGLVTLICCCAGLSISLRAASIAGDGSVAIVTAPSTILSTVPRTPGDRSQEAMLLHEGTRVSIIDSVASRSAIDSVRTVWYDVEVDNAHRAWINAADVTKVKL